MDKNQQKVIDYIKNYRMQGYSDEEIKQALVNSGINDSVVNELMNTNQNKSFFKSWMFIVPCGLIGIFLILMGVLAINDLLGLKEIPIDDSNLVQDVDVVDNVGDSTTDTSDQIIVTTPSSSSGSSLSGSSSSSSGGSSSEGSSSGSSGGSSSSGSSSDSGSTQSSCDVSTCSGYACDITNNVCYIFCSTDSSCSTGYSCFNSECIAETECFNQVDDDSDSGVDYTGGCDVNSDNVIDYVCGCYNPTTLLFEYYDGPGTGFCADYIGTYYDCMNLADKSLFGGISCGVGEDIEGVFYLGDADCESLSDNLEGCSSDDECVDSSCNTATGECVVCTDTDSGTDIYNKGSVTGIFDSASDGYPYTTVEDYCVDENTVYEYFCNTNSGFFDADGEIDCGEGYTCLDGACVEEALECSPECVDSSCNTATGECVVCTETDSGTDIYNKGSVTGIFDNAGEGYPYTTVEDYCVDENTVYEYFCNTNSGFFDADGEILCGSGYTCSDGACVEEVAYDCNDGIDNDDDSGVDYTGGCDVNSDNVIDYVCGCYNPTTSLFEYYDGPGTGFCADYIGTYYDCMNLADKSLFGGISCGVGEDIEGVFYFGDADCESEDDYEITNVPASAPEVSAGFLTRFFEWLIFWN